ncbi:MAG: hypothetical protein WCI43_06795 [Candidatus Firestonebacteria bacterium]
MKTYYLALAVLFSGALFGKTAELLSLKDANSPAVFRNMKGAAHEFAEADKSPWLKVSFSDKKYSLVYFEIKRSRVESYFDGQPRELLNAAMKENVWAGYDEVKFDYLNQEKSEQTVKFWLLDRGSIASYCRFNEMMAALLTSESPDPDPKYLQMGEVVLKLKPGRGTASIKLSEDILTVDKRRAIDISDIRVYAFRGNNKEAVIYINNIRLEGASSEAGVLPETPPTIVCPETKKGYHDAFAGFCPFCGAKSHKIDGSNNEPKTGKGLKITPEYAGGYGPRGGGGDDQTEKAISLGISHYDDSFWENRAIFSFKLLGKFPGGVKVKKAELRAYALVPGKPYYPVMEVYSVPERFKIDPKKQVCWNTQPPVDKLLFVSGVYNGADSPRWFSYDVTDYFKAGIKNNAVFEVRSAISALTYDSPHPKGHYLLYEPLGRDASKAPYLYIETE